METKVSPTIDSIKEYPCDLCGSQAAIEVPYCRVYTNDQPVYICRGCGFVHVKLRRSAQAIARSWSEEVFGDDFANGKYSARIPAVKARQVYVAGFIDSYSPLKNKYVGDIGAGEGQFLEIISGHAYGARVFGVEPSLKNCQILTRNGFDCFNGIAEDYRKSSQFKEGQFDVVTMTWTLCNSFSCRDMLAIAHQMLKEEGHLVIGEGSRILVPFKKPLHYYFNPLLVDLHPFHFSAVALRNLFWTSGFEVVDTNRYIDTDYLCVIGKKSKVDFRDRFENEDYLAVKAFFERWHQETQFYRES